MQNGSICKHCKQKYGALIRTTIFGPSLALQRNVHHRLPLNSRPDMDNFEGSRTARDQETPSVADGIAMRRDSLVSHDSRTVTSEESHTAKE